MKSLYLFILEKFKINSNTVSHYKSQEDWSILNAEDGDFVRWHKIYFIYKCLNKNHEYADYLDENTIISHVVCNSNVKISNSFHVGPRPGVGFVNEDTKDHYHLMSDDEKEQFIKIINDNGYRWDEYKKELVKL